MSLNYTFPMINHIDDVLPALDDNFRVVEKEYGTFINYNMMGPETFPPVQESSSIWAESVGSAIRRECRGIAFHPVTSKIMSRPFHKFFNVNEREETSEALVDLSLPHTIFNKLDGSMIRPIPVDAGIRWGTKMGFTDVGMLAEEWVAGRENYEQLASDMIWLGCTPIFEFVSNRARIVLSYPEENLVLLAIRNNFTGRYMSREALEITGKRYGVPVVTAKISGGSITALVKTTRDLQDEEGVVVAFANGHRIKSKADQYVKIHKAKDMLRTERALVQLILAEGVDDLLPIIPEEDKNEVLVFADSFWKELGRHKDEITAEYSKIRDHFGVKKDFALAEHSGPYPKGLFFSLWDNKLTNSEEAIMHLVQNGLSSETKWKEMKEKINFNTKWREDT